MTEFRAPHVEISPERRAVLEDPKRRQLGLPPPGFGNRAPIPELDREAVYTFPEIVLENGMPLVIRGTLRAAQEARKRIIEEHPMPKEEPKPVEVDSDFDPANEENIRALGYVGGFGISAEDRVEVTTLTEVDEQVAA